LEDSKEINVIDLIIVNFNSGEHLSRCVESVLASTIPVRVFVIDNHSTDRSLFLLKNTVGVDPRLHIIENKENMGFARANNYVLSMTKGDYILFLNPDCIIKPDTLECMLAIMESHPDVGIAGCLIRNPDGSEQAGSRRYIPTPLRSMIRVLKLSKLFHKYSRFGILNLAGQPLPDRPVPMEAISGAFMFVRRKAMEQVGPMDDKYFMHCEDLDWCMRFCMHGWKILFVPEVEIIHTKGVCSADRPIRVEWYKHMGMVRFYRKYFRHQYPVALMYLVMAVVWTRFTMLATMLSLKRLVKS
jgi:GT2 family glycosyltransferase